MSIAATHSEPFASLRGTGRLPKGLPKGAEILRVLKVSKPKEDKKKQLLPTA